MGTPFELETFGSTLRRCRKLLDLTQAELGRLAGCSAAAIRKFEADERKPSRQLAELLAAALQIPPQERAAFMQLARGILPEVSPGFDRSTPYVQLTAENLPAPLTSLVDRVGDLEALSKLITDPTVRWLTLLGPPGIGKTRLSIQSGRQVLADFPDGVWFVDLAPLDDPSHVLPAVSRTLASLELPPAPSLDQLASALKRRTMLLVLDNCEHLTSAAVEVAALLKRCPCLKVLATSRIPLNIYGEHIYRVPPLSVPPLAGARYPQKLLDYESVQLFVARARQHQPSFAISPETAPAIVEITNTLDGIPLALELAAATLQRMSLAELDTLLHHLEGENWLRQVATPARDLPERQHTLENVVAWSYTLLSTPQQELFSRLSVFSGWLDAESAAAVCYSPPQPSPSEVRRLLDGLADHSLLVRELSGGAPCWRMLEIIHEYASLQLNPAVRSELEARRADHFLGRLQSIAGEPDPGRREAFFHLHIDNLQVCLKWAIARGETEMGFRLVGYLEDFWDSHGYLKEILEYMKQLFTLPDPSPPGLRAYSLEAAADLAWQQHDFDASLAFLKEAIELRRLHGLTIQSAMDFNRLGRIYIERGEYALARQALEESLAIARSDLGSLNPGSPLAQLGELALFEGCIDEAKALLFEALTYLDESEDIFIGIATIDLAEVALAERDFHRALDWLCRAHAYARLNPRRLLVYLCAAAGYLLLAYGSSMDAAIRAARIYGAIQAIEERSGVVLSAYYHDLNRRRIQFALQRISGAEWQTEYEAGQRWSAEFALNQAKLYG